MMLQDLIVAPVTAIVFMFTLLPIRLHSDSESRSVNTIALLIWVTLAVVELKSGNLIWVRTCCSMTDEGANW